MKVIWTTHATQRQQEWKRTRGVSRELVEAVVRQPSQIVPGDRDARVAQSQWQDGLLRIPFLEVPEGRRILTVYWTSRRERYWRGLP